MPSRSTLFGVAVGAVVVAIVSGVLLVAPRTAQADPHALFYTAIGQRQLFFNVLAALDQADYVEPATGDGGVESRQRLLDNRNEVGFGAEQEPAVEATNTSLSALLTRSITLEGNDLYTQYLSEQFAIERARRRDIFEVLKTICEVGFGIPDCDPDRARRRPAEAVRLPQQAYVVKPLTYFQREKLENAPVAAALSGSDEHQQEVQNRINPAAVEENPEPARPYAYDIGIEGLRLTANGKTASGNNRNLGVEVERSLLLNLLSFVTNDSLANVFVNFFRDGDETKTTFSLSDNNNPRGDGGSCTGSLDGRAYAACWAANMFRLVSYSSLTNSALGQANSNYDQQLAGSTNADNTIASYELTGYGPDIGNGDFGLEINVEQPLATKRRIQEEAFGLFGDATIDAKYKTSTQANSKQGVDSVLPGDNQNRQVQGARTGLALQAGEVVGQVEGAVAAAQDKDKRYADDALKAVAEDGELGKSYQLLIEKPGTSTRCGYYCR